MLLTWFVEEINPRPSGLGEVQVTNGWNAVLFLPPVITSYELVTPHGAAVVPVLAGTVVEHPINPRCLCPPRRSKIKSSETKANQ